MPRFHILTSGSRGDCQPYVALALGLIERGHTVLFSAEARQKSYIEDFGLDFESFAGDPTAILFEKESQQLLRDGKIMALSKKMEEFNRPFAHARKQDMLQAATKFEPDIIITGALVMAETFCIAESLGAGYLPVILGGTYPTSEFPLTFVSSKSLPFKWMNKLTYSACFWMLWSTQREEINEFRQQLNLPPITERKGMLDIIEQRSINHIIACHEIVLPSRRRPADWPCFVKLTNFMFVPSTPESNIDIKIRRFFHADPKSRPLYLGFGSMPAPDPAHLLKMAIALVRNLRCRAILCAGWSSLEDLLDQYEIPESLLVVRSIPHDYAFPRCFAAVHHCGIGTSAAALRAGIPSVPCPVMLDQPHNAAMLYELGVAPQPIRFTALMEAQGLQKLTAAVRIVATDRKMRNRAKDISFEIRESDGVADSCKIIETMLTT